MAVQFLEIAGNKVVVLDVADYERLLANAEDLADIQAADAADRRRAAGEEYVPMELVERIIGGESPLRVWRTYRGLTLTGLAERAGTTQLMLSQLENGKLQGRPALWRRVAEALNVSIEDILPVEISD